MVQEEFPDTFRQLATYFVHQGALYYGLGRLGFSTYLSDFWKFTPNSSSGNWDYLGEFANARAGSSVLRLAGNVYVGLGMGANNLIFSDWYVLQNERWQTVDFSGVAPSLHRAVSFSHGESGYVLMGRDRGGSASRGYEVTLSGPSTGTWREISNLNLPIFRDGAVVYQHEGRTFVGLGLFNNTFLSDWHEFSPAVSGYFIEKSELPAPGRSWAAMVEHNGQGFLFGGLVSLADDAASAEIWKYVADE